MEITTLLFDLDDTLIELKALKHAWLIQNYPQLLNLGNMYVDKSSTDTRHHHEHALFSMIAKYTNTSTLRVQRDFQGYIVKNMRLNSALIRLLNTLKKRYKLGIVTNGSVKNQKRKIAAAGLNKYFECIIISGEIGVRKPHAEIFNQALNQLDSLPENTLFIGDNLKNDIAGADHVGMQTCWLNTHQSASKIAVKPTYKIDNILKISSLLS